MLIVTMVTTIKKLATSPVAADSPLATSRMITNGLRKRERNCSQSGDRLTTAASLGPKVFNLTGLLWHQGPQLSSRVVQEADQPAPSRFLLRRVRRLWGSLRHLSRVRCLRVQNDPSSTSNHQIFIWRNHPDTDALP